ncbi:NAD(P)H-dependent glycerol-3-phosphate dehydrogenase [Propylenella binzhouense]|uniref:Glycerol-3-phosphate dehydrogenase [NAD(P)+] n=1 Tax=Propylenella binzhouense TaxID=2555902 RepID=A0A964WVV6_9HYPH|nr:NAD(P)-dependent glycerol-3-phosphate dehydrogenase [Propylenella binzhouense]
MSGRAPLAIVGGGAFGTALACVAARSGRIVHLLVRDPGRADRMAETRENPLLPGVRLEAGIVPTADPAACGAAGLVLLAVPAQETRSAAAALRPYVTAGVPVVGCAKGIERATGRRQQEVIAACLPEAPAAVLSGPGFAAEIARGLPTAVTIAADEIGLAHRLCADLSSGGFRPYASDDPVGVEIGGATKNVLAIACGVVAGRQLGESARAALIARGLAEMTRLGIALGGKAQTFTGLSGLGDLVLTATSAQSRNTAFGIALGGGRAVAELLAAGMPLAEGVHTAAVAVELARRHAVEVPIMAAVAAVLEGGLTVEEAIEGLVSRPLKAEAG